MKPKRANRTLTDLHWRPDSLGCSARSNGRRFANGARCSHLLSSSSRSSPTLPKGHSYALAHGTPSNSFTKYHSPTQNSHCATTDRSSASPALNQCAVSCDPQSPTQTEFQYPSWSRHLAFSDLMKTLTILSQQCDTDS